MVLDTYN